jgi:hypothetical protein
LKDSIRKAFDVSSSYLSSHLRPNAQAQQVPIAG